MAASQGRVFVLHFYSRPRLLLHPFPFPFPHTAAAAKGNGIRTMMTTTTTSNHDDDDEKKATPHPPNPIPNRPLRGRAPPPSLSHSSFTTSNTRQQHQQPPQASSRKKSPLPLPLQSSVLHFLNKSLTDDDDKTDINHLKTVNPHIPNQNPNPNPNPNPNQNGNENENADFIFKKMKETGLIPNAVAMLDGLCKDGLVHEAMKLFGLMRDKGTIPDVVIYTAVVEGFCKAHKPDDAKRIFNKMLTNGITPNAFTYSIFIQGLCYCDKLDDALHFSAHMLQAGHSPNLPTFVLLLHSLTTTRDKGVEQARAAILNLKQSGLCLDEKAVRDYLDKKAPSMPLVWEALFGNKTS